MTECPQKQGYYQGAGSSATSQDEADQRALGEVASSIRVVVTAVAKGTSASTWFGGAMQEQGAFEVAVSTVAQQEMEGVQITRRWYDPGTKRFWACAEVEKRLIEEQSRRNVALLESLEEPRFVVSAEPSQGADDGCGGFVRGALSEALADYHLQVVSTQASQGISRWLAGQGLAPNWGAEDLDLEVADFVVYTKCRNWFPVPADGDRQIYASTRAEATLHSCAAGTVVAIKSAVETDRDASDTLAAVEGSARRAGAALARGLFEETIRSWFSAGAESKTYRIVAAGADLRVLAVVEAILAERSSALFRRSYQDQVAVLEVRSQEAARDLCDRLAQGLRSGGIPLELSSQGRVVLLDFRPTR
jgi:hypothetical protein